jgi:N-dimethylarginine dimethylaminohydrolase
MLKFAEKKREAETEIVANELEKLNFNLKELPTKKNILAEGGEFYFCPKDKLLFSGINRNTIAGAEYVASFLNANELILIDTPSFHLDTVFTTVFDKQGALSAMIVCEELITKDSFKNLEKISVELNVHIITIPAKDSIGTDNQLGSLAVNSFCAPGLLISSSRYSNFSVGKKLESLGVKTEVCPVSQFQLSGGSVHCLTNEL